jgi:putative redox protein
MIVVYNQAGATQSRVAANQFFTEADTTPPAGKGAGFRPHELLEAALASCTAITLRMIADQRGLHLDSITVAVEVDRSNAAKTVLHTKVDVKGDLSDDEREFLLNSAQTCPVRKTLSKELTFTEVQTATDSNTGYSIR